MTIKRFNWRIGSMSGEVWWENSKINMINKIKKLITQLLCYFNYHSWDYDKDTIVKCNRTCNNCKKKEHSVYDMSYGTTIWYIGHYW